VSVLTPYLCVGDARAAMSWYAEVLDAHVTLEPVVMDDGRVGHVEMSVAGARGMMADPFPDIGVEAPAPDRGAAVTLQLDVSDVDAVTDKVIGSGIASDRGPEDTPHGRVAVFRDPFGHRWMVSQQPRT
jgi:PhnB protein